MSRRAPRAQGLRSPSRRAARAAGTPRGAAVVAGLLALALVLLGPPGGDAAAHLYQTQLWREHGWQLWDNLWYAGRYSLVNYSLLYFPLSALVGTVTVVAASAALAAWAFARLVTARWPGFARGPVAAFAVLVCLGVVAGTYPFLMGLALALWALVLLDRGRRAGSAALCLVTTLAHPLAMVFLAIVLAGVVAVERRRLREPAVQAYALAVVAVLGLQLLLVRAFASDGAHYPFRPETALAITAFCIAGLLLTRGVRDMLALRAVFVAYGLVAAGAFTMSSPLGGNVERLLLLMGVPLLLLPLAARGFRPRGVAVACLAGALLWQSWPAVAGWRTASEARAPSEEYWYPVIAFLERHHDPGHRVEVVATADNWEAYHLARRGIPLARGWFRQDDFPGNAALYEHLTPARYRAWLRRVAVRYVLLPDDPLEYSSRAEAALLRRGDVLPVVARLGGWTVYELPDATPIVTPTAGARVVRLTSDRIVLRVTRPGRYRLSLRYTPYMSVRGGGEAACISPARPWGTVLRVARPGTVVLRFDVRLGRMVDTVFGRPAACGRAPEPVPGAALAAAVGGAGSAGAPAP
ncbi:MAG TPA: hypothetical protein VNT51_12090 [Miltoncostaeaceae bacterium]|nr:hypothetical protein [Miltoncostaeaceae bacterium]